MAYLRNLQWLLFFLIGMHSLISASAKPHIVVIMADELGWDDVSYRNENMETPNIDDMIRKGVHLTSSYMAQSGTTSRIAFMTGKYPYKMGLQHADFPVMANISMPTEHKILPEQLKEMGYSTYYVGKWGLGFCSYKYTPTNRGFDRFYGMYLSEAGYSSHRSTSAVKGYDLHDDTGPEFPADYSIAWDDNEKYSTDLFTDKAVEILKSHDKSKPLFLMLSYQAVHAPLNAPQKYMSEFCTKVKPAGRRRVCVTAAVMDKGVGKIRETLQQSGYADDFVLLFTSDNGGHTSMGSSNWPLRGGKHTLYEGGTRVVTVLESSLLTKAPYEWDHLMTSIDWFPTLVRAAGRKKVLEDVDGVDNWRMINEDREGKRTGFIYNIDDVDKIAAIREGRFKLHEGTRRPNDWSFPPPGATKPKIQKFKNHDEYWLYDLQADVKEEFDLSRVSDKADILDSLKKKLKEAKADLKASLKASRVDGGLPSKHENAWKTGFCDNKDKK